MPRAHRRIAAAVACAIFVAIGAESCSLFVDLSDLSGGSTSDASTGDVSVDSSTGKDAATDSSTPTDAGADASACTGVPVRVQSAHVVADDGGGSDMVDVTFPGTTLAGDFIVVGVNYDYPCTSVTGVSDSAGNTYTQLVEADSYVGALVLETWGSQNVSATSADTITATFAAGCTGRNLKAVEYSGIALSSPIDGTVTQHGDGGDTPDAPITTTGPVIVFAHTGDESSDNGAGDGWTQIFIDDWATIAEERSFSTPTTVSVTAKPAADDSWVIQGVALKACPPN